MLLRLVTIFPKNFVSFLVGLLVDVRWPGFLLRGFIGIYCRVYRVDLSESMLPIKQFKTFNEFFTRELKSGARPLGSSPLVHPCDAVLIDGGRVTDKNQILKVKGQNIGLDALFGGLPRDWDPSAYQYGLYYLSPKDYHRVHAPVDCMVESVRHIPGVLWPVNDWAVRNVEGLFIKNERLVFSLRTKDDLPVFLVMIGALNVGRMTTPFDKKICTNRSRWAGSVVHRYKKAVQLRKGEELGRFNMGSSVILIAPQRLGAINFASLIGMPVKLGANLV